MEIFAVARLKVVKGSNESAQALLFHNIFRIFVVDACTGGVGIVEITKKVLCKEGSVDIERVGDIRLAGIFPFIEAFRRLREAKLEAEGDPPIPIYRDTDMRTGYFHPEELNPIALYTLRAHLEFQRRLREHLIERYQIDTLDLSGLLHLETPDGAMGMAPPIVEICRERVEVVVGSGQRSAPPRIMRVPILLDGLHRATVAREEKRYLKCIVIVGIPDEYPPHAYPVDWTEVIAYDRREEIPVDDGVPRKKFYRFDRLYSYMRPITVLRSMGECTRPPEWGR